MSLDLEKKDSNHEIDDIVRLSNGDTKTLLKSELYCGEKSKLKKKDGTNSIAILSSLKRVHIDEDSEDSEDSKDVQDSLEYENFFNQVD